MITEREMLPILCDKKLRKIVQKDIMLKSEREKIKIDGLKFKV